MVFLEMKYDISIWTCLSMGPIGPYLSCIPQRRLALLQLSLQMVDRPLPFGTGTTVSSCLMVCRQCATE